MALPIYYDDGNLARWNGSAWNMIVPEMGDMVFNLGGPSNANNYGLAVIQNANTSAPRTYVFVDQTDPSYDIEWFGIHTFNSDVEFTVTPTINGTPIDVIGFTPDAAMFYYNDFLEHTPQEWGTSFTGSGATFSPGTADASHPGVVKLESGTSSTGVAFFLQSSSVTDATKGRKIWLDSTPITVEFLVRYPTVPSSAEDFYGLVGLLDSTGQTDRIFATCKWDSGSSSARWQMFNTGGGAGSSNLAITTTVSSNTWYKVALVCTSTLVSLYVNGTPIGELSTNISTNGMTLGAVMSKVSGNTNRTMEIDYVRVQKTMSANRY